MWPWSTQATAANKTISSVTKEHKNIANGRITAADGKRPMGKNKTSAEIISETKSMLANGTRLISTRRPVTPREPKRQLYGKTSLAGRPPSAFSLRYLQFESRALPSLGPLPNTTAAAALDTLSLGVNNNASGRSVVSRSGSLDAISKTSIDGNRDDNGKNSSSISAKLPSLLVTPKITASMDNLSASMPPRKDFRRPQNADNTGSTDGSYTIEIASNDAGNIIKKNPPMKVSRSHNSHNNNSNNNGANTKVTKMPSSSVSSSLANNEGLTTSFMKAPAATNAEMTSSSARKKTGASATKRLLPRGNDILTQSSTETLLDMLKSHANIKECSEETALHINGILTELYTRVKGARGDWRCSVLGALYGLVECTSPKILISVARVVLVLRVNGSNLTGACKLVFKVARNERNDSLFVNSDVPELLIDGLARASPIDDPEACVYGYGAVRFLTNTSLATSASVNKEGSDKTNNKNKTLAQRLVRHGIVPLMIIHLQVINEAGANDNLQGQPLHALFQLSGAIRTLAKVPLKEIAADATPTPPSVYNPNVRANAKSNINHSSGVAVAAYPSICETPDDQSDMQLALAAPHLVRAAEICHSEIELQTNIVRTLSVLSEQDKCCDMLADAAARLGILLGPCPAKANFLDATTEVRAKPYGMLSRVGYILGNIMAKSDVARVQFFNNDVAMEFLLTTLEYHARNPFMLVSRTSGESESDTVLDVLIKLIRVIANMSVNAEVGCGLGARPPLGAVLLTLLLTNNKSKANLSSDMEELLLATLGAIHNLSFYQNPSTSDEPAKASTQSAGSMNERVAELTAALCVTYQTGPMAVQAEVARVLGNMTRSVVSRQAFCTIGGMQMLVATLAAEDVDLIGASCGVLVNLLSDWQRRAPFRELGGPLLVRDVLQRAAMHQDWLLASIACQALWNYLIDTGNVIDALGEDEADYISNDLLEYLDEERIFKNAPPDPLWEQFAIVAADLLERIQASMSYNNTPCDTSDDEHENERNDVENAHFPSGKFKKWLQDA